MLPCVRNQRGQAEGSQSQPLGQYRACSRPLVVITPSRVSPFTLSRPSLLSFSLGAGVAFYSQPVCIPFFSFFQASPSLLLARSLLKCTLLVHRLPKHTLVPWAKSVSLSLPSSAVSPFLGSKLVFSCSRLVSRSSLRSSCCGSSVVLTSESYFSFTAVAGMYTGRRIRSIQRSEGRGVQKQREYVCRIMVVAGEKGLQVRHARLKVSNRSHVMVYNACLKRVHWD